jgi:hypothetical protein
MPTRQNPFYQYRNPAMGNMFAGLAEAIFPAPNTRAMVDQSAAAENMAQAQASYALADERDQNTRGKRIKNDRYAGAPTDLAQLFLSGGNLQDEPLRMNPGYQDMPPTDFSLMAQPAPAAEPMFTGRTATDQLAAALQQMEAYGFRPDQMMDAIGKMQYLNAAGGADPQAGLPYAPFVGVNPGAGTALTPEAQGQISMRDSNESIAQALATAIQQGENSARVANINQAGANQRNNATIAARQAADGGTGGVKPSAVPTVSPTIAKALLGGVQAQAQNMGLTLEPAAIDFASNEAARRYQDPESPGFKNVQGAVLSVVDDLVSGAFEGVESETDTPGALRSFFGAKPTTTIKRTAPAAAAPAQAQPPAAAVEYLRANPNLAADFDRKYGQGASKQYLK